MTQHTEQGRVVTFRETRLTLADLFADLIWPRLLRTPGLGLQPARVGIALFTLVIAGLIGHANTLWSDNPPFHRVLAQAFLPKRLGFSEGVVAAFFTKLSALLDFYPLELFVQGIPMLAVLALGSCAISRMAAADLATSARLTWPQGLAYTLGRALSVIGAALIPFLVIGLVALLLALCGWAFLQLPVLNLVGAILFPVAITLAILGAVAGLGLILGGVMLVPAIACEGTDAIDAVQRTYAYVFGRLGRLILYGAILALVLTVTFTVLRAIGLGTTYLATEATGAWLHDANRLLDRPRTPPGGMDGVATRLITFWINAFWLLLAAAGFSCFVAGSTILYLLMRQVTDGQDWAELWFPGATEAAAAEVRPTDPASTSARAMTQRGTDTPGLDAAPSA